MYDDRSNAYLDSLFPKVLDLHICSPFCHNSSGSGLFFVLKNTSVYFSFCCFHLYDCIEYNIKFILSVKKINNLCCQWSRIVFINLF